MSKYQIGQKVWEVSMNCYITEVKITGVRQGEFGMLYDYTDGKHYCRGFDESSLFPSVEEARQYIISNIKVIPYET